MLLSPSCFFPLLSKYRQFSFQASKRQFSVISSATMKPKANEEDPTANKELTKDFSIQIGRIERILNETLMKLKLLTFTPILLDNNGEILRRFLPEIEVQFICQVCVEDFTQSLSNISEHSSISCALTNLNMFRKKSGTKLQTKLNSPDDSIDSHIAYVVDVLYKNEEVMSFLQSFTPEEQDINPVAQSFIDLVKEFKDIIMEKLKVSAIEEINYENDLKNAYRSNNLLSDNVREIEEQLDKQREELSKEYDRKYEIMQDLLASIEDLKQKTKTEVAQMIVDSETVMMKDYNKSTELQEILSVEAKVSTQQYENLLRDHLLEEKNLRARRFKVETQLSSWLAKYDQDIGEKQAEFEEVERQFNEEQEKFEKLKEDLEDQEELYLQLMWEKEEEERIIYEQKAYIFLMNRSARLIQRYWREYRIRKLARKRGKKGKKSAAEKKGKKEKKQEPTTTIRGGPDPNALIDSKFGGEIMEEIKDTGGDPFANRNVTVDLNAD